MKNNRPIIDALGFAQKTQSQDLRLKLADLPRLTDVSAIVNDVVQANVTGGIQHDGKSFIELKILSGLTLTCQRCIGLFDFQINSRSRFIITPTEDELVEISQEAQDINMMLAENELDLIEFVEDELLLALPMVPLHEEGDCERPQLLDEQSDPTNQFSGLRQSS